MTPKNSCANCKWFFPDPNKPGQGACGELDSEDGQEYLYGVSYAWVMLGESYCAHWAARDRFYTATYEELEAQVWWLEHEIRRLEEGKEG